MVAAIARYQNDQSTCAFIGTSLHLTIDIMDLVVANCYICKFSGITVFYYQAG